MLVVAGDSDYIPLVTRCKRMGREVIGLGIDGALGFDLADMGDVPTTVEAWDMGPTQDIFVLTLTGTLPLEADVRERLRGLAGVTIEASVLQRQ